MGILIVLKRQLYIECNLTFLSLHVVNWGFFLLLSAG